MDSIKKRAKTYAKNTHPHRQDYFLQAVENAYMAGVITEVPKLQPYEQLLDSMQQTNRAMSKRLFDLLIVLNAIAISQSIEVAQHLALSVIEKELVKESETISK